MASTSDAAGDDMFDEFLASRGHEKTAWQQDYNKKRCPECGGIHDEAATTCTVCGWNPAD